MDTSTKLDVQIKIKGKADSKPLSTEVQVIILAFTQTYSTDNPTTYTSDCTISTNALADRPKVLRNNIQQFGEIIRYLEWINKVQQSTIKGSVD